MPCICGICNVKVDRNDPKVKCLLCNVFFHGKCCNLGVTELGLVEGNFKCQSCLSSRRRSLSTTSNVEGKIVGVMPDAVGGSEKVDSQAAVTANTSAASSNTHSPSVVAAGHLVASSNAETPVVVAGSNIIAHSNLMRTNNIAGISASAFKLGINTAAKSLPNSITQSKNSNVSLELIYNEMVAMKKENYNLHKEVISLREELLSKVKDLDLAVRSNRCSCMIAASNNKSYDICISSQNTSSDITLSNGTISSQGDNPSFADIARHSLLSDSKETTASNTNKQLTAKKHVDDVFDNIFPIAKNPHKKSNENININHNNNNISNKTGYNNNNNKDSC